MLFARQPVWRLRIEMVEVDNPVVWRLVELDPRIDLEVLHEVIQAAMGWDDCHLHVFETEDGIEYGEADPEFNGRDETTATVADLLDGGRTLLYTYDFGDNWRHRVTRGSVSRAKEGLFYPNCADGAGACPPEDAGGAYRWNMVKPVVADPGHEDHHDWMEWLGLDDPAQFRPDVFDRDAANGRLRDVKKRFML
ncbi:plasmid pRiA4b ORF-3 family protein [Glycomyces sp. YM15]|uniref:plasmid pRiA4b ORF-3 family protein n=1 Tax=Glycomyces sp. YM15 TaxID=2800446 RepID=UPI0019643A60|nr:plasmid pRiA4b ORF-3 family protein [Glycomyces sp. YM15]